ncbi:MAG: DUF6442 family protein [Defluviitaleaceae bacterium]|nr:DUF6442 family protein [Defluviitaleaceae bacterium]
MSNLTEIQTINRKEEILEKSRQARKDEGAEYAEYRGHKWAANASFIISGVPILIYSILFGQLLVLLGLVGFIEAYYACLHGMAYKLSKENKHLFISVICAVLFIVCAFMFARVAMGLTAIPGLGGA